jgi:hypothetical protein
MSSDELVRLLSTRPNPSIVTLSLDRWVRTMG